MNKLGRSIIYRGFMHVLVEQFGEEAAKQIWAEANRILKQLEYTHPDIAGDSKIMVLPAAALYKAVYPYDAEHALELLKMHGTKIGIKLSKLIYAFTSIPGLSRILWRNMPKLMREMSSPKKGYTRRIVSETNELVAVDILSCPLHDAAAKIGVPEVAQVVCAMDRAYMTGFKHIQYTRTTSVAEGDACCDYRLQFDRCKR